MGTDRRALGIVRELDGATRLGSDLLGPVHHLGDRLEARRCRHADGHAGLRARQEQGMRDVVPVPEVRQDSPVEVAEMLADREEVGQRLAGVLEVREGVDHRDRRRGGEDLQALLLEGPEHDRVDVARQDTTGVLDRLTATQLELRRGQHDGVRAELFHPDLERDTRAGGGLLEDQRDRSAGQRSGVRAPIRLQCRAEVDELGELGSGEVVDAQVVTHDARV